MNLVKRIGAGFAGAVLMFSASAAMAADIQPVIPAQPPVIVVPPAPAGFDWTGPYVGAFATLEFVTDPLLIRPIVGGGQIGYNIVRGSFLFGPQLRLGVYIPEADFVMTIGPRAGILVGAEDRILLYAATSFGWIPNAPAPSVFYTAGGGVEVGLGERFSFFGETRVLGVPTFGCCGIVMSTGVNLHF